MGWRTLSARNSLTTKPLAS